MKPPRLVLLAVSGAALLTLTGCAQTGDVAVKVGGTTYTNKDVDLLVGFQCAAAAAQASANPGGEPAVATTSRAQVRAEMASRLFDSAVYEKVGKDAGVEPDRARLATDLAGLDEAVSAAVKPADRKRVIELITDTFESASRFEAAFVKKYGQTALQQMDQDAITAAAADLKASGVRDADIELDPVYGLSTTSPTPYPGDASLSLPVSSFAKDADTKPAPADWLAGLPKNQTCG